MVEKKIAEDAKAEEVKVEKDESVKSVDARAEPAADMKKKDAPKLVKKHRFGEARETDAKISMKHSKVICDLIRGRRVSQSRKMLEEMIEKKRSINGKYHTNAVKKILEILRNAEANATANGLDPSRLFIYTIKADKGRTFYRPRSLLRRRSERAKMTHIEITVGEK